MSAERMLRTWVVPRKKPFVPVWIGEERLFYFVKKKIILLLTLIITITLIAVISHSVYKKVLFAKVDILTLADLCEMNSDEPIEFEYDNSKAFEEQNLLDNKVLLINLGEAQRTTLGGLIANQLMSIYQRPVLILSKTDIAF